MSTGGSSIFPSCPERRRDLPPRGGLKACAPIAELTLRNLRMSPVEARLPRGAGGLGWGIATGRMIMRRAVLAALAPLLLAGPAAAETLLVGNKGEDTLSVIALDSGAELARLPTGKMPHEIAISPDG